ncbi:hypothetical protein SteCoe_10452 [Stentor coeruleus]|uniref:cGMP-dependent protein kinase n=1 Tax=Stentor coeruleus TaxID=5963 RepID=A0A1R2CFK3_9CILI|nr:hypothetical protein SteCoe_10452 [Stentor coeruleus]
MGGKCLGKSNKSEAMMSSAASDKDYYDGRNPEETKELLFLDNIEVTDSSKKLVLKALSNNHLFKDLSTEDFGLIYKTLQMCVVEPKKFVFKQGSTGSLFFIINSGMVEVIVDDQKRGVLTKENCFGDMALLSDSKRKASIRTLNKCSFWVLSRQKFMEVLKRLLSRNYDKIRKIISKAPFFSTLAENHKDALTKVSILHKYEDGEIIIHEGDEGNLLFILNHGTVVFMRNSQELIRISTEGVAFGESSLLTGIKRTASCVSYGVTEALSIDQKSLQNIFGDGYKEILLKTIAKHSLLSDPHLSFLNKNDIIEISDRMKWVKFNNGSLVLSRNYTKNMLKVVCVGSLVSMGASKNKISPYQVIGLNNINERGLKAEDYVAQGNTIIGELENLEVEKTLGIKSESLFDCLDTLKFMKKVSIFRQFSLESIRKICETMKKAKYKKESIIFEMGAPSDSIMIVKSGIVEIIKDNKVLRLIGKYESFGERALREKQRSASAFSERDCEVFVIPRDVLLSLPEIRLLKTELERKKYYQKELKFDLLEVVSRLPDKETNRMRFCVKNPNDDLVYDLLAIPKYSLQDSNDCMKLVKEKEILLQLDHNLIVKMVTSSKNERFVFFVREFIKGAILRTMIPSTEDYAKMIILYLTSVLEYLHDKGVIYRELTPDNIIIGKKGFPYLSNFKNAKVITDRTISKVGNPFYMAPEMILGRGYSKSIDYWSLGIILHELLYSGLPFDMSFEDNPTVAYEKILQGNLKLPQDRFDIANQLISKLICNSKDRIESYGIKRHTWMSNLEWEKLINMNIGSEEFPRINTDIVRTNTTSNKSLSFVLKVFFI